MWRYFKSKRVFDPKISPDEVFMDSENIPGFDTHQFEGRIEKAISRRTFVLTGLFFLFIGIGFFGRLFQLQVTRGEELLAMSKRNTLRSIPIFSNRGVVYDRNEEQLAWNGFGSRLYTEMPGLSHVLGYVGLPSKKDLEQGGVFSSNAMIGKEGIEKRYDDLLLGKPGLKLIETDSQNKLVSESVQRIPEDGKNLYTTIDSRLQSSFYDILDSLIRDRGFRGGAGVILDVDNGEVLSLVSWPEYSSQVLSNGKPAETINGFFADKNKPFLNRAISGLYAPGSIIKPLIAIAALNEEIIAPEKQILSTGSILIPNPYFPDKPSIFRDWKAHGWVDMREALAVSSDVYFYTIGGGYEGQKGLGIDKIGEYARLFGFGSTTRIDLAGEQEGVIPTPELKAEIVPSNPDWRVGDTYNSSIGQGYFQVTPIEMAVYAASLANSGKIIQPHLIRNEEEPLVFSRVGIPKEYFEIAREGMRKVVMAGTAGALNVPAVKIAAKTGTAEVGMRKQYANSWVIGFFPYEKPKYAFTIVLEKGPAGNLVGGVYAMRQLLDWMAANTPEYFE